MSQIFGNSKSVPGCFVKEKRTGNVKGAVFNFGGGVSQNSVVTRFSITRNDDYVAVKCLGDKAYINLFGKAAVAEMDVTMTLFLIKGKSPTGVLSSYNQQFSSTRLAKGAKECSLTVGSKALVTGYAVSMSLGGESSEIGLADATVHVVSLKDR